MGAVLTDALKKDEEHETDNTEILEAVAENIYITSDEKDIEDIIKRSRAQVVIGSSLEKKIAEKNNVSLLEFSYPIYHRAILNQTTVGVRGAVEFVSDYITTVKQAEKEKSQVLHGYLKQLKNQNSWQGHTSKKGQVKQINLVSELASRESI